MKAKKKQVDARAQIQAPNEQNKPPKIIPKANTTQEELLKNYLIMISKPKSRRRNISLKSRLLGVSFAFLLLLITYSASPYLSEPTYTAVTDKSQLKAAIVDQLSLTFPNQAFVEEAMEMLRQAGFVVDYYEGKEVTVDFYYRRLASRGYAIIVMRTHSAIAMTSGGIRFEEFSGLFTSENYSTITHIFSQLSDELKRGRMSKDGKEYFVVTPEFIKSSINGRFPNTLIILMGCSSIRDTIMADAFVSKGALALIGWNDLVTAFHTDEATLSLLQHLIKEENTIDKAVNETMHHVGPDPVYEAVLRYYPAETGNLTIQNIKG